ncbi:MAG: MFS transporter [Chloroflexi bacterium]|nr:MFS transporter [Chloroflexota bacterium]
MTSAAPPARNRAPLIALYTANAISMVGNMLTAIAIPWFVLQTTGSATQTGITGFFSILPVVIAGLFGGTLIDRLGYQRTSIIADLASGVTVALVPVLYFTIGLQFWQLMVLVFFGALLDAPGSTARSALIPDLAELAGIPIERAAATNQVIERSSRLIGAPLAGLLIAVMGTANVLWLDAASFLVSAGLVVVFVNVPAARPAAMPRGKYFQELGDGLKFLYRDRLMLAIVIFVMLTNSLDAAYGNVVRPVYVNQVFGSAFDLGLIIAANGGGAVLGAIIYGAIGHRLPRHATFVSMFMLTSLRFWVMALYPSLAVILIATFVTSIGAGPLNPIIDSVEYERIPPHMRGRVFGTITATVWAAMPLGTLIGGVATEQFGVQMMLIVIGAIYMLTTFSMAFIPAMRQMDQRKTPLTLNSAE